MVAAYLTSLADGRRGSDGGWVESPRTTATLARRLAAIRHRHRSVGAPFDASSPVLRDTWRGIQRAHAAASHSRVPTVTELLRAILAALPDSLAAVRDRALLLVGFAGAFRRSELVAIDVSQCAWHPDGLIITLPESAGRPYGPTADVGLPYGLHPETCPVRAVEHWLAAANIAEGPVFRSVTRHGTVLPQRLSDRAVALVMKRAVARAQAAAQEDGNSVLAESLDPARYAGHSLRAGFIISAAAAGVPESDIMRHTRHRHAGTVHRYARHATVFRQNAAAKVGL